MGGHLQSLIMSFAVDYSRRLNVDILAAQTAAKFRLEGAIKSGVSREVVITRADLASSLIKKNQTLVIKARLKCLQMPMTMYIRRNDIRSSLRVPTNQPYYCEN